MKRILGRLTAKQEVFCRLFATKRGFFGNGVQSYMRAYDFTGSYQTARLNAGKILNTPHVIERIRSLLDIYINDLVVDKELAMVITQYADLPSKVAAIREYNRVKRRVSPEGTIAPIININIMSEEVKKAIKRVEEKKKDGK